MLTPKKFYEGLWKGKQEGKITPLQHRDWFHRYFLDFIFNPRENSRHAVALRLLKPGERLLDIGCWDGQFLDQIEESGLFQKLYGIDMLPEAIAKIRSKGYEGEVVDLNTETFPFPDNYFDTVTFLAVLEHVFDPYGAIREIRRILRPNGILIVDVPNVGSFSNRMRILLGRIPVTSGDPGWDGGHLHYFTKYALDQFLQAEGFEITARKASGGRPRLREWWLSLLAGEMIYSCKKV